MADGGNGAAWTAMSLAMLGLGVAMLRLSWLGRGRRALLRLGGWAGIAAGFLAMAQGWGGEVGVAYACLALSPVALLAVAAGAERRAQSVRAPRQPALDPEERPSSWTRSTAKALLSIPLAGIAAIGIGVAFALHMPMEPVDRIVIGGLLVPVLWGGGMAWTLSDARLLRATLVLTGVSLAAYASAFLPKVLG
ncbi:MAG: hypothetical protein NW223_24055 [Hyphomicrobiaceae bacterium]|nr:hypothetical protein [Hyphomicrobiaceae bacterium]